jgi:hypothetical protein
VSAAKRPRRPCRFCGEPSTGPGGSKTCDACKPLQPDASRAADAERRRALNPDAPRRRRGKCAECQSCLPLGQFHSTAKGAVSAYCRPCTRAYERRVNLKNKYGITEGDYWALYDSQDQTCAICRRKPRSVRLSVDHDHSTGEVRGLLCSRCNHKLLGAADESIERLQAAIDYLREPPARKVLAA